MCLSGECENCRAQVLAASKAAEADSRLYPTKKKPPESFKLLKPRYATAAEMLAHADDFGGTLVVLALLDQQTKLGG